MSGVPRLESMHKLYAHCIGRWNEDDWNATDAVILSQTIDEFSNFDCDMGKLEKRFGEDYSMIRATYGDMRKLLQQIADQPVPWPGFRRGSTVGHRVISRAEDIGGAPEIAGGDLAKRISELSPEECAALMIKVAQAKPLGMNS